MTDVLRSDTFWTWFAIGESTLALLVWVLVFVLVRRLWQRVQPQLVPWLGMFGMAPPNAPISGEAHEPDAA